MEGSTSFVEVITNGTFVAHEATQPSMLARPGGAGGGVLCSRYVRFAGVCGVGVAGAGGGSDVKWTPGLIQTEGGRFTVR